jgi:hypothetical protein
MDKKSFYIAAKEIREWLGFSPGAAQAKLRELCAGGVVRSWRQPFSMAGREPQGEGPPERIEPSAWRTNEIDLMTDADGCSYFVDVSTVDLDAQLGPMKQHPRDAAITKRLKAGDRPGKNILWKVFCDRIRKDCNVSSSVRGFSNETIEDATKRLFRLT